jgi:hypothetical protein
MNAGESPRWFAVAEVFGLTALAFAHPIADKLWENDEFFFAHASTPGDVVALIAAAYVLAPLALGSSPALIGLLFPRVGAALHAVVLWLLLVGFVTPAITWAGVDGVAAIVAAGVIGLGAVALRARFAAVREFFAWTAAFAVLSAGGFVTRSSVFEVLFPGAEDAAAASKPTTPIRTLVVLVFDEMPLSVLLDDQLQIDAARFPAFGALAASSHWFRNASAVSTHTTLAVPAILDGKLPSKENKSPSLKRHPNNLFTMLDEHYAMDVYEELTHLCPAYACPVDPNADASARLRLLFADVGAVYLNAVVPADVDKRFKINLPDVTTNWSHFWGSAKRDEDDEHRRERFDRVLETFTPRDEPVLHFAHHVIPHMPYQFMPSGKTYAAKSVPRGYKDEAWLDDDWARIQAYQQFLAQVQYVDAELGRVLDRLRAQGRFDEAMIVVTTDHGASFLPGHHRRGTYGKEHYYEDVLSIPLLIKLPGQAAPVVDDRNVSSLDILPTIAGQVGVPVPHAIDGQDLFAPAWADPGEKRMVMGTKAKQEKIDEIDRSYELISFPNPGTVPRYTLDWKLGAFGTGASNPRGPWGIGPRPELLGTAAPEVVPGSCRVELSKGYGDEWLSGALKVAADARSAPAHVFATVFCAGEGPPAMVAAAIDGRIVATTRTVAKSKATASLEFLLPEDALGPGDHTLRLLHIDGALQEIAIAPPKAARAP